MLSLGECNICGILHMTALSLCTGVWCFTKIKKGITEIVEACETTTSKKGHHNFIGNGYAERVAVLLRQEFCFSFLFLFLGIYAG